MRVTLPPEPGSGPLVQTLRWAFRPLPFMQECREKLGDSFSVKFLGFERPMVMISDPEAIKALYTERANGLPPGRNIVLEPIMGSRSVLLLEGDDHLARRKLMLPAFHGERMRSYQPVVEEIVAAEVDSWPLGEEFPIHSRMQAVTLEVILRVVFGVADGPRLEQLRGMLGRVLAETASPLAQLVGLATRRFGGRGPWAKFEGQLKEVDELLYAEIAERRADPGLEDRDDILSLADAGALRGRRGYERLRAARPADDPAAGRPRDDRDGAGLDLRPAASPPAAAAAAARLAGGGRRRVPARDDRRVAAPAPGDPARRPPSRRGADRGRPHAAAGDRRHAGDLAGPHRADIYPEPFAFRPERFLEEGPDTYSWIPYGGGIRRCLGASFAEFEMRIMLSEVLTRCDLHKASPTPEKVGRRNITLSPRDGTPVVVTARRPAREPVLLAA